MIVSAWWLLMLMRSSLAVRTMPSLQRSGGNSTGDLSIACNSLGAPSHDQVVALELQGLRRPLNG